MKLKHKRRKERERETDEVRKNGHFSQSISHQLATSILSLWKENSVVDPLKKCWIMLTPKKEKEIIWPQNYFHSIFKKIRNTKSQILKARFEIDQIPANSKFWFPVELMWQDSNQWPWRYWDLHCTLSVVYTV